MVNDTFDVACPECGVTRKATTEAIGKACRCPCGARFHVFDPRPSVTADSGVRHRFQMKGSFTAVKLLIGCLAGALTAWKMFATVPEAVTERPAVQSVASPVSQVSDNPVVRSQEQPAQQQTVAEIELQRKIAQQERVREQQAIAAADIQRKMAELKNAASCNSKRFEHWPKRRQSDVQQGKRHRPAR